MDYNTPLHVVYLVISKSKYSTYVCMYVCAFLLRLGLCLDLVHLRGDSELVESASNVHGCHEDCASGASDIWIDGFYGSACK